MKAELILMGKRLDMAPRNHRRNLVILIYAGLGALMAGSWLLDRWHTSGVYMIFATILINRMLLGGYNFGGLIKPFNGRAPQTRLDPPPFLVLGLRLYELEPGENEYRNDEREVAQRDHAHYLAYQTITVGLVLIWMICSLKMNLPHINFKLRLPQLSEFLPGGADTLLYGLTLATIVVSQTLPQAILLWSEPDMPEFGEED